ncbi:hypothetical protein D3C80_2225510 [compost metagenome]
MPVEGRTCARLSHPTFKAFFKGYWAFTDSGSAKKRSVMAKALRTSARSMPWFTTWKKPTSTAASHS